MVLKIKTFRSVDNKEASLRFAKGHSDVLASYGIEKVTSSNFAWIDNPAVYVILVESEDEKEVLGGAKLHLSSEHGLMPIEEALSEIDPSIFKLTRKFELGKTGEICGLWNTRSMSGTGLSTLLVRATVAKSGILLAQHLQLQSLFAFCAPWTVQLFQNVGYDIVTSIGNNGTYPYPKEDLPATVMMVEDIANLQHATEQDKETIFKLRINPVQTKEETSPKGPLVVEYNLLF